MTERSPEFQMDELEFFDYLLEKTRTEFQKSKTHKKYPDKNWNYAICETPIQKGTGVFFGLNWGGNDVNTQSEYPKAEKEKRNWKFVSHSRRFFRDYFSAEIEDLNYSNLCFFRSPEADKIHPDDWELAIPLFKKYIDYIKPPWTLFLGSADNLSESHLSDRRPIKVWDEKHNKTVKGCIGSLFGQYPLGCVPHPNARPISSEARKEIWRDVTQALMKMSKSS